MRNFLFLFLFAIAIPASAQFRYAAWNVGPQLGSFKITNGMSRYDSNGNGQPFMADSANPKYGVTNIRFNIEAVELNHFVKAKVSLPIVKHAEHDSGVVIGKQLEGTMQFGFGFKIKDRVGFQFGLNFGILNISQSTNSNPTKFDYFVPSAGATPLTGQKIFGEMGAWEGGLLVSNIIAFSDNLGLQTMYSHNNLKNKRKTINGRNDQLEFTLLYGNPDWHNLGFSISVVENWMHFNGYDPNAPANANSFARIYPPTKVRMATIYIGINFPIVFRG